MKYDIHVITKQNDQPAHDHPRFLGIKPSKTARIIADTAIEEYDHLTRAVLNSDPNWEVTGSDDNPLDVKMTLVERDGNVVVTRSTTRIVAVPKGTSVQED